MHGELLSKIENKSFIASGQEKKFLRPKDRLDVLKSHGLARDSQKIILRSLKFRLIIKAPFQKIKFYNIS